MNIRVRFAPSPTGYLHVGNARTALITWLFARKHNGHFLLRIDDTDQVRSKIEYEKAIEESLIWMGLSWDEKVNQKNRTKRYNEIIENLKSEGLLYPCYETAEELGLKRKSQLGRGLPPIYDRSALNLTKEEIKKYEDEGRSPHWRFKLKHEEISWNDMVRGDVRFHGSDMSDPVVIREDGSPLYHLCSVIDDIDYNITHIVRGEDHVSNTACHIQMIEAIGGEVPTFAHLPLLSDNEGGKLSKRLGSLSVLEIREKEGLENMALVSLMAKLGTSDPIDAYKDISNLVRDFDFSKFSRNTPKFDAEELMRLNAKIIHDTDFGDVKVRLANMGLEELDENFWNAVKPNLVKLSDIKEWWKVATGPVESIIDDEDIEFVEKAASMLPAEPWDSNTWKIWTDAVKAETGRKGKNLFMPLRKALTGMNHGPELALLLPLIGYKESVERLTKQRKAA